MEKTKSSGMKKRFEKFIARERKDIKSFDLWRGSFAEFLGVLLLTFLAIAAGLYPKNSPTPPSSVHVALEAGFFIAVIISSLSTVSGGHVNPAISIGFLLTGEITLIRFFIYTCSQVLGAIAGAGLLQLVAPSDFQEGNFGVIEPGPNVTEIQALACEFVITFLLLLGTFAFIDKGRTDVQGSIPLMIGLIVVLNILAAWNISGGCMNPARNFGPAVVTGNFKYTWIYWVGPMVGAVFGSLVYDRLLSTKVCKGLLHGCRCVKHTQEIDEKIETYNVNVKHEEIETMTSNVDCNDRF